MEITGKIIQVLQEQGGVSRTSGKEWKMQAYVLETQEQYPRKVHFEIFGDDRIKANPCRVDDIVTVSFDLESREFNGRWYTSVRAWKVETGEQEATDDSVADAPTPPSSAPLPGELDFADSQVEETTDLPF